MKIALYSSYFYPYISGLTNYPLKVFDYISKENKVEVITFRHDKSLKRSDKYNDLLITRMPFIFRISKGFISPQSISTFIRVAKENDVIFLNAPNVEAVLLAIIAKLFGKKVVTIFVCQLFLGEDILSKVVNLVVDTSVFIQALFSDEIIGIKDYAEKRYLYKAFKKKFKLCIPLIDKKPTDNNMLRKLTKEKGKEKWVGFVGRVSREKGLSHLTRAVSVLKNQDVRLVFAGPYGRDVAGEEKYYNNLIREIESLGIKHKFLGRITDAELGAFYESLDVLVLPSVNKTEAFGMVQAEAMLEGVPVVSSDIPGVRLPVLLTKMGLSVDVNNNGAISGAIKEILDHRSKFSNESLRKNAAKVFSNEQTLKVFESTLER